VETIWGLEVGQCPCAPVRRYDLVRAAEQLRGAREAEGSMMSVVPPTIIAGIQSARGSPTGRESR